MRYLLTLSCALTVEPAALLQVGQRVGSGVAASPAVAPRCSCVYLHCMQETAIQGPPGLHVVSSCHRSKCVTKTQKFPVLSTIRTTSFYGVTSSRIRGDSAVS